MNWKLAAGRMRDAWRSYPALRRRIAAVPPGPPIFLTGTHRSGTTWLAKMLAASGIWYVHEPFNPNKGRWPRAFTYVGGSGANAAVDALAEEVLVGGFRAALNLPNADKPWMPLRLLRTGFSRMLIKDPLACLLSAYLTKRHGLQTLILFRHPAGFAASVCRLGWPRGEFLRAFLADEALMEDHLRPYRALIERYASDDSLASAAVLHGALNTVLWRFSQQGVGTPLQFEQLCLDPIGEAERLFRALELPYDDSVRAEHVRLCLGRPMELGAYRAHEVERNSRAMASSWQGVLDSCEIQLVRSIWEQFDVPLYRHPAEWSSLPQAGFAGADR